MLEALPNSAQNNEEGTEGDSPSDDSNKDEYIVDDATPREEYIESSVNIPSEAHLNTQPDSNKSILPRKAKQKFSTLMLLHRSTVSLMKMLPVEKVPSTRYINGVQVDSIERSSMFNFFSLKRPWFRAFHLSWISLFLAFQGWFAFA